MKKTIAFVSVLLLVFSMITFNSNHVGAVNVQQGDFKSPKSGFVKSTYKGSTTGGGMDIEYADYYMSVKEARTFASKLDQSNKSVVAWAAASFIPGIGPYITIFGTAESVKRGTATSAIRKLTDKNKKVHVTVSLDKRYGSTMYNVSEWSGTRASIVAFKAPAPKYQKVVVTKVTY
ncbi:hypothetical protein HCA78_07660 [Listeria booriae]|uniref:Uncharacterized protein n=1 Tax=Listeria booriae TaxID=1552123 RepID=A0A842CP59_9LIST|nr:hypothetical protein [Listeria booriae]MBC2003635.1 hypothetical protein [Listeria booriae]